jgi:hypothetical protein
MPDKPIATYSHRAKPYSAEAEFRLMPAHLRIEQGRRSGDFPYHDIVMVRLTYKPGNTTNEGYMAKLYRRDRRTASLTNLSWKGLVEMERRDADYRRFVELMIAEIRKANPGVILQAGMPGWQHKITAVAGLAAVITLVIVTSQAALHNSLPMAALTAALGLYFGWWTIRYLARNRPRGFTADALPEDVLPRAETLTARG